MQDYITAIMGTAQKLQDAGKGLGDDLIAVVMLRGLREEFRPLKIAIENSGIEVTSKLVRMKFLQEDLRTSSSCGGNGVVVFVSKKKEGFTSRGAKSKIGCYGCNKLGHIRLNYPKVANLVKKDMKSNVASSRSEVYLLLTVLGVTEKA
ncbi:hypothetical protein PR048_003315 [Dryococelus australis]|uniref:Uncharacterized protein n=1 Tax=Dryococelus australis TaxID=614101 RepID=A0ABQ9IMQ3_9NEOP|nr:hypothetical protein PR048_003315 [Dryococelus australis]